jgi:nitroreductase
MISQLQKGLFLLNRMEFDEVIRRRRSIRSYESKPVPEEVILKILNAARLAPSAKNRQPWKFIVVRDEIKRKRIAEASHHQKFIAEAPVIIVAVALEPTYVMSCGVPAYPVDLAIAFEHICLSACNEGLGTCWIGAFDQKRVKEILKIPEEFIVVALTPLGYPKHIPPPRPRKTLEEIISFEEFK